MNKRVVRNFFSVMVVITMLFIQNVPVEAEEYVKPDICELIIFYEDCTHESNSKGYMENNFEDCHDKVISMESNYMFNPVTGSTEALATSGEGWKYDIKSNTLTLTNFKGSGIFATDNVNDNNTMTIELVGENILTGNTKSRHPINFYNLNMLITGKGTLKIVDNNESAIPVTILNGDLHLSGESKLEIISPINCISVQENDQIKKGGHIIVDKGCSLIGKTSSKNQIHGAIYGHYIKVGGTIIGDAPSTEENLNTGITAGISYEIEPGVIIKIGLAADNTKNIISSEFDRLDDRRPYMEFRGPTIENQITDKENQVK